MAARDMLVNKLALRDSDVSTWSNGIIKLSFDEVCNMVGIDIVNDRRNRFFWGIKKEKKVLITEEVLTWLGYTSKEYSQQKQQFMKLVKKNPHIVYKEIRDEKNSRKKYVVLDVDDFESVMLQMRTPKAHEMRRNYSLICLVMIKYREYEHYFERHKAELLERQNYELMTSLRSLNQRSLEMRNFMEEERQKAEQERFNAEQERRRADEERRIAEEREQRAQEQRRLFSSKLQSTINLLRVNVAPNVVPPPISKEKIHRLGLYRTSNQKEWYLMRRQCDNWNTAERKLFRRSMTLVKHWDNVSHAIDIGNTLKRQCRSLTWVARGNLIQVPQDREDINETFIVDMVEKILVEENEAHRLAKESEASLLVETRT